MKLSKVEWWESLSSRREGRRFDYDRIFRPNGYKRTFGEMSAEEKHGIPADGSLTLSHRARAFQKFARARL
jgi:XTP/dITP diphosphohydrolase